MMTASPSQSEIVSYAGSNHRCGKSGSAGCGQGSASWVAVSYFERQSVLIRTAPDFKRVLISDLKVRWGSCTPNSNLNFNWRIIKAPSVVIDYLIVHELAHLIESNHTPRFWNIVSVQVPRAEWAKQWLLENGDLLEIDF